MFADKCPYCAARLIQVLQRGMNLSPEIKRLRCRQALVHSLAQGLDELEIRRMAKLTEWQVCPAPEVQPESLSKPRKRGR